MLAERILGRLAACDGVGVLAVSDGFARTGDDADADARGADRPRVGAVAASVGHE